MTFLGTTEPQILALGTNRAAQPTQPLVHVLGDRCAGCQECVVRCPTGALDLDVTTWTVLVDQDRCVACGQCVRTCPFSAITVAGAPQVSPRLALEVEHPASLEHDRHETRRGIATWVDALAEAARCLDCPDPTCVRGCPVHNDIPGFIRALGTGDLDQAHEVLRRTTFLPDVCSRVCDQALQCEGACTWSLAGAEPVAIGALERFVADNAPVPPPAAPTRPDAGAADGLSVAVVGSGPAGLSAAAELVGAGATVTLYEQRDELGGLLRWGIPDFTLPDVVARRLPDALLAAGVEVRFGYTLEPAGLEQLRSDHDAVVLATGASLPLGIRLPGSDLDGVWDATRFLVEARHALTTGGPLPGVAPETDRPTVLVLGGGNTAMDVARSARRLGAAAICVDWMDPRFAPVRPDELAEARAEGVEVRFSRTLTGLNGEEGRVRSAELAATVQERAAERPRVVPNSMERLSVDLVVTAMGYRIDPDLAALAGSVPVKKEVPAVPDRRWIGSGILAAPAPPFARRQPVGRLAVGRGQARVLAGLPRLERTWVVGDALVGPSTVVEAMAQGKVAAQAIVHHAPRRPAEPWVAPRRVLIGVESRGGTTAAHAAALANGLVRAGHEARVLPLRDIRAGELAWADALVVATWVEGFVLAGAGPAKATRSWLATLPPLAGMPVGLLCTYAVSPGRTLQRMRAEVERHGGRVVAGAARCGRPKGHQLDGQGLGVLLDAFSRPNADAA